MKNVFVFERFIRPEETKFLKLLLNFENLWFIKRWRFILHLCYLICLKQYNLKCH
jgi:hypothetical protein